MSRVATHSYYVHNGGTKRGNCVLVSFSVAYHNYKTVCMNERVEKLDFLITIRNENQGGKGGIDPVRRKCN